jgi:hypothetical protein
MIPLLLAPGAFADEPPQAPLPGRLNLVVVEGEGAINNIKLRTTRQTIVQVEDENRKPVAGAMVVFLLPSDGAGGTFVGGARTVALTTDSAGRAVMPPFEPNNVTGKFQIRVNASHQGRTASTTITQSNVAAAAGAAGAGAGAGLSAKVIGIIVGVAAAGAVGAAVGLRGGGNGNGGNGGGPGGTIPTGAISAGGAPSIGPPR